MKNSPFGDCKTADLHLADEVQSFGALIAIDKRTQLICACSENSYSFVGRTPEELLGKNWNILFTPDQVEGVFKPVDAPGNEIPQILKAEFDNKAVLIANHSVNNITLVEIEHSQQESFRFNFSDTVEYLHALAATFTVEAAAKQLMEIVSKITQFDRVMLYKFLPDWHGEVIAESLRSGIDGFLGLRFPATDVPANARRLYLINWQRAIADVYSETVPIRTAPYCDPIDFTFSQLRAVHPAHIQYLKNIGTEASFSISIVVAGKLWGLIACHYLTAKQISLAQRQLCEQLARMTSIHMSDMNMIEMEKISAAYRVAQAEVKGALRSQELDKRAISTQLTQFRQIFKSQGIWAHLDNKDYYSGDIPDEISLSVLRNWLETYDRSHVTACSQITSGLAKYPALVRFASGFMYIPLNNQDFLLLMRHEQVETVNWAGKPQSLSKEPDALLELTPRSSFQQWSHQVKGVSDPWYDVDIEAAGKLREFLIEHIEKIQLETLALHDPLTGLANRLLFERKMQEAIKLSIRNDSLSAVYMLDLDKFKPVNDTLGHAAGDELLIKVSERLKGIVRERDVVARLGGDEFAIIQFHLADLQSAQLTAERILSEIRRPFSIMGQNIEIGVSIGVAICPFHSVEEQELVHDADLALYQAKRAGRAGFKVFTNSMLSAEEQNESTRIRLIQALENKEFFFVYQPIVNSRTRSLHSFEVFARWIHPEKGVLPACEFLPAIEQYQLSLRFAELGIRQAIFQVKQWQRQGLPLVPISLNISPRQFLALDIVGYCSSLAMEFDMSLEWLRFELDETALQTDFQQTAEKITFLAQIGVLTNIDHFGHGMIALKRLLDVKINHLKISAKQFTTDSSQIKNNALFAIIASIGKGIHVPVVATQIETVDMETQAMNSGIELLQGNLISHSMTAEDVIPWLRSKTSKTGSSSV